MSETDIVPPDEMRTVAKEVGAILARHGVDTKLIGFALLIFNYGEGGSIQWISTARRQDMLVAMLEFFSHQPGGKQIEAVLRHWFEEQVRTGKLQ